MEDAQKTSKMVAWHMNAYGTYEDLKSDDRVLAPAAVGPKEVLVRVKASSVNPIDVLMAGMSWRYSKLKL